MTKYVALKSFRGQEGPIRRGQDMPDDMTPERIKALERQRLIERRKTGEAPPARNQALPGPKEPPGMVSPNAGGLVDLGWDPNAGKFRGDGTRQARDDAEGPEGEGDAGNGEGAAETIAPIGSSTSATDASSSSQAAPPPAPLTSPARSAGRPKKPRGNRPS